MFSNMFCLYTIIRFLNPKVKVKVDYKFSAIFSNMICLYTVIRVYIHVCKCYTIITHKVGQFSHLHSLTIKNRESIRDATAELQVIIIWSSFINK